MLNKKLSDVAELKNEEVNQIKKENESLKKSVAQLQQKFNEQQKLISQNLEQLKALVIKQTSKKTVALK